LSLKWRDQWAQLGKSKYQIQARLEGYRASELPKIRSIIGIPFPSGTTRKAAKSRMKPEPAKEIPPEAKTLTG
jgi:hypothetical protein